MIKRNLILIISLLLMNACSYEGGVKLPGVYRVNIQQGNVIEQGTIDRLRPGMDKNQVQFILGTPAIIDPFHTEQWEYIFTLSEKGDTRTQRHLRIHFENDRLAYIDGNVITTDRTPDDTPRASKTVEVPILEKKGFFGRLIEALPFIGDDDRTQAQAVESAGDPESE